MSKPRRPHTDEVTKRAVVREIRAGELTEIEAATRLGVSRQSVRRWMERAAPSKGRRDFVAVDLTPAPIPASAIALVEIGLRGGRTLRVPLDVPVDLLRALVGALEPAC